MDSNHNKKIRSADILAEEVVGAFKKKYLVIGRGEINSWKAWLVIGIMVGITIANVSTVDAQETVDASSDFQYTSIDLDTSNNPHIAYYDITNKDLKYAKFNGASWIITTVDSAGIVGLDASLDLDTTNNPHIAYSEDSPNYKLKYAKFNGVSWDIEVVDSIPSSGGDVSLALDTSNNPHISYSGTSGIQYAKFNGVSWDINIVAAVTAPTQATSIALDSSNNPHISYWDQSAGSLIYAKFDGASWDVTTVDSDGPFAHTGLYSAIAIGLDNNPHISYVRDPDGFDYRLKYARFDGASWTTEFIDSSVVPNGLYSSIAIDSTNKPHISYQSTSALRYAVFNGVSWVLNSFDPGGSRNWTSLALDASNNAYISYIPGFTNLKYIYITAIPLPPDTTPPTVSSVVPANGATGVSTGANVIVTFSEAMNAGTVNTGSFQLSDAGGPIDAAVTGFGATFTLDPFVSLTAGTVYSVEVKGSPSCPTCVKDVAGNALVSSFFSSFTTATGVCSGPISLSMSPSPTTVGTSVTPTAAGLSGCSSQVVDFRLTNCSGSLVSSCSVGGAGTGCSGSGFSAPAASATYDACVDLAADADTTKGNSPGESTSALLTISVAPSPPSLPGPGPGPAPCAPGVVCFGNPLGISTFTELVDKVSDFVFLISLPIATLLFVISGVIFMTSAGNTKLISTSKQILIWTTVGLAVIFLSKVLASILLGIL